MPEKIIIEFDDKENSPAAGREEKIIIDLNEAPETAEEVNGAGKTGSNPEEITKENISSFYNGNRHVTGYFKSEIEFPSGIENGFGERVNLKLKDRFLNSMLENNRYIILSSASGNVYLIDRLSGKLAEKFSFGNEAFEKTGAVQDNIIYLNSLSSIYRLIGTGKELKNEKLYSTLQMSGSPAQKSNYIWSNLNIIDSSGGRAEEYALIFLEYNNHGSAYLKVLNLSSGEIIGHALEVKKFISDRICVVQNFAVFICDDKFFLYDISKNLLTQVASGLNLSIDSKLMYINDRIYFATENSELYYFDFSMRSGYGFTGIRFTGIKEDYINSLAGYKDFIFTGTLSGWKCYGVNGMPVYDFEDSDENKIEAIGDNILIVSKKNRIIFHNLNRFQEAESTVIPALKEAGKAEDDRITSAFITRNEIFILTTNGILKSFINDLLNIHV